MAALEFLLDHHVNPDVIDAAGLRPVDFGALAGLVEVVRRLHRREADLCYSSLDGRTLLHHAAASSGPGAIEVVEYLLHEPVIVDAIDKFGWTPVHVAVNSGNLSIVERLLVDGTNVNQLTRLDYAAKRDTIQTWSPLHLAVRANHNEIVDLLLSHSDIQVNDGHTPLFVASQVQSENLVKVLLENGARVDSVTSCGDTPLSICCSDSIRSVLELYKSSQQFYDRCLALLEKPSDTISCNELTALVPLITSVYDLRMLLTFASRMEDISSERSRSQVRELIQSAVDHILSNKLVLDDHACVFFHHVRKHCSKMNLVSPDQCMLWKLKADKVNMESAGWVVELKKQVHRNNWRLDIHDQHISMITESMKEIHSMVMENRQVIQEVTNSVNNAPRSSDKTHQSDH
ncbi:hypothetical protein PPTG_15913 [Phytophthora nicotianae INRA-310]|uniref:Uncharacterized protein n=1 Tax=Phytophthora nicotianae (strain INRA-310) TaxID=761204 RepID=W2PUI1_PHYN3|nr:hypothetical protein PPTG_15913 [Phytophthora nicotianae INRA-310]ETN03695.1 hypothetical protein PPTG_15913 [Phytophthora nicotianae INRA-310]